MPKCDKFELDTSRNGMVICDVGCSQCCFYCVHLEECGDNICPEFEDLFECDMTDFDEACLTCRFVNTDKCPLKKKV